ncbi:MAG: hypothetical protein ACD_80C00101G0004, partial [uncultured bacterium (gcode 4)]
MCIITRIRFFFNKLLECINKTPATKRMFLWNMLSQHCRFYCWLTPIFHHENWWFCRDRAVSFFIENIGDQRDRDDAWVVE